MARWRRIERIGNKLVRFGKQTIHGDETAKNIVARVPVYNVTEVPWESDEVIIPESATITFNIGNNPSTPEKLSLVSYGTIKRIPGTDNFTSDDAMFNKTKYDGYGSVFSVQGKWEKRASESGDISCHPTEEVIAGRNTDIVYGDCKIEGHFWGGAGLPALDRLVSLGGVASDMSKNYTTSSGAYYNIKTQSFKGDNVATPVPYVEHHSGIKKEYEPIDDKDFEGALK